MTEATSRYTLYSSQVEHASDDDLVFIWKGDLLQDLQQRILHQRHKLAAGTYLQVFDSLTTDGIWKTIPCVGR